MLPIRVLPRLQAEALDDVQQTACISIRNPRQSDAQLSDYAEVLRLGFHDHEWPCHMFTVMTQTHARQVLEFGQKYRTAPLVVHCEYGASRSVAVGLFLAVWLERPLLLTVPVLLPNKWVLTQLRLAALGRALATFDLDLMATAIRGPLASRFAVLPADIAETY